MSMQTVSLNIIKYTSHIQKQQVYNMSNTSVHILQHYSDSDSVYCSA